MRVAVGRVGAGRIVLEGDGEPLPEGRRVMVIIEDKDGWTLGEEEWRELQEAMDEAARKDVVSADEVFAALPPRK